MSKNPFQILDFLGYFFPGATVMIALYIIIPELQGLIPIQTNTSGLVYIVCVITAYVIGHILSLVSSITVEKYAIWKYGYPSDYLLNDFRPWNYFGRGLNMESGFLSSCRRRTIIITKCIFKVFVLVLLLPISLLDLVLSLIFAIDLYYTRKLPSQQVNMIRGKCQLLFKSLGISESPQKLFQGDYHRIVHNYYYENAENHRNRMDNCVAIYDFLRAMSLVSCICFLFFLIRSLCTINFSSPIDLNQIFVLLGLSGITYLFYMGFLKFYRKFTVENFMCLLCDNHFEFPKAKESGLIFEKGVHNPGESVITY